MPVMKKTILYSLFIVSSINFSLHSQDAHIQDNEDLLLVFDDGGAEEIYPLEDTDTVCLMPEIQNYVDDLEFDPTARVDSAETIKSPHNDLQGITDTPPISEDLNILDHATNEKESSEDIVCQLDEDQIINCQAMTADDVETMQVAMQDEENSVPMISQDQLEEILNTHSEELDRYLDNIISQSLHDDIQTISIDNVEMMMAGENGILLHNDEFSPTQETEFSIIEDDDIIPVPHDLINSVKKANKKKKKLEKLERKERANFFKKSKKQNKKKV